MVDETGWRGPERRTSLRLRALIDELRMEIRDTRDSVEFLRERVSTIGLELEVLKRGQNQRRLSSDSFEMNRP